MSLEIYQIIILIIFGAFVGIIVSFIGQTGQGIIFPLVYLITNDIFLALTVNVLNDLIAALSASTMFIKNKQIVLRKDIFFLIIIALIVSFFGVLILMITPLGSIFGWFLPLFITILGLFFIKNGFPTKNSVKRLIYNISLRILKRKNELEEIAGLEKQITEQLNHETDQIEGIIPSNSKLYYLLASIFGIFIGFNSGMFGANSGLIIVLALIIVYGFPLKKGIGTALVLSILVSINTFFIYQILGVTLKGTFFINLEISFYLAIGSISVGMASSIFIQKLSAKLMGRIMGLIIIILGMTSFTLYFIT